MAAWHGEGVPVTDGLRDELRALPGVADAEVDGDGTAPASVRVRLHPEADPQAVGLDIQRVLASHGMRSRIAAEEAPPVTEEAVPPRPDTPPPMPAEPFAPPPADVAEPVAAAVTITPATAAPEPEPAAPATVPSAPASDGGLASIAVEESADGVVVVATGHDGRRYTRRTEPALGAVTEAVVAVAGALAGGPAPRLVAVTTADAEGSSVVTVVVERADGHRAAGAAIVAAGHAFAVGRATWSALHG